MLYSYNPIAEQTDLQKMPFRYLLRNEETDRQDETMCGMTEW